jgi:predicted small integral membrane protein
MVFTPVGVRCRPCAQLRKAPQCDVSADRLAIAGVAGLATAFVAWFIALQAFFFIWIMSILVGLAVGEVASRITKRRVSRSLEILVGADIVIGFLAVGIIHAGSPGFGYHPVRHGIAAVTVALNDPFSLILIALAVIAGVTRLRR